MKILMTICLSLFASIQLVQAEAIVIGNNSEVDFSSLPSSHSGTEISIENQNITGMILGNITVLISNMKWTDTEMADYQQRYGSNPHQLVIAAFDNKVASSSEEMEQSDSKPAPVSSQKSSDLKDKEEDKAASQALAETFSTRDGSTLLYLYISEFESSQTTKNIALFFTEDAQEWFTEQGLIAIPDVVYQQNLVTLGLKDPKFEGGYK